MKKVFPCNLKNGILKLDSTWESLKFLHVYVSVCGHVANRFNRIPNVAKLISPKSTCIEKQTVSLVCARMLMSRMWRLVSVREIGKKSWLYVYICMYCPGELPVVRSFIRAICLVHGPYRFVFFFFFFGASFCFRIANRHSAQ